MRALTIGGATLDTVIEYEKMESLEFKELHGSQSYLLLKEGEKIEVTKHKTFSGGGATNAAFSLRNIGYDVSFFGKVGKDKSGDIVLRELIDKGIDTSLVQFSKKFGTGSSYVIPSLKNDRTIFAYRGANLNLLTENFPIDALMTSDIVYITSLSRSSSLHLPRLIKLANKYDTKVIFNPGSSQLELNADLILSMLSGIDILILNYEEAHKLSTSLSNSETDNNFSLKHNFYKQEKISFLKHFVNSVSLLGLKFIVITDGNKGVYIFGEGKLFFHKSVNIPKVMNTLGAGDAFGSSFSAAIYLGEDLFTATQYGLLNSASVIQYLDTKSGLLTRDQIRSKIVINSKDYMLL